MCSYQKVKISPPLNKRLCEGGGKELARLQMLYFFDVPPCLSCSWSNYSLSSLWVGASPPPHFSPGRVLHQDCRSQCACAFASPRTALKLKRLPHYTAPFSPLTCCKGQFPQNWLWVWTLWPLPCRESHARTVTQPALLFWPRIAPSPAEPHLINLKRNNHPP